MVLMVLALVFCAFVSVSALSLCPDQGWFHSEIHTCYWLITVEATASNSHYFCNLSGGQLAVIPDQAAFDWITSNLTAEITSITDLFWIGLTDSSTEGTYMTFQGQTMAWASWRPGNPADTGSDNLDCVAVDTSNGWGMYDDICSTKLPGLCSLVLDKCPSGSNYLPSHLLCYWVTPPPPPNRNANDNDIQCQANSGRLGVIPNAAVDSEFDNPPLSNLLTGLTTVFIGVTDAAAESSYLTYEGNPVTWTNWDTNEPNDPDIPSLSIQDCVVIKPANGRVWRDIECPNTYQGLCYRDLANFAVQGVTYPSVDTTMMSTTTTAHETTTTMSGETTSTAEVTTVKDTTTTEGTTSTQASTTASSTTSTTTSETTGTTTSAPTSTTISTTTTTSTTSEATTTQSNGETTTAKQTTVSSNDNTAGNESCTCPCEHQLTLEEIQKQIDEIKKELTIDVKKTSAYIRTKTSIYESRPVAQSLGAIGVTVLCFVFGSIVMLDAGTFVRHIKSCFKRRR